MINTFKIAFIPAVVFICASCHGEGMDKLSGQIAGGEKDWTNVYSNVRQLWLDYLSVPARGSEVQRWRRQEIAIPAVYHDLLMRYLWAVNDVWIQRGELRFIVIDEDGRPIDDTTREVYDFVKLGADLEPRFRVTTRKVAGEQHAEIKQGMMELEISLKSTGHRWTNFRLPLGRPGADDEGRLHAASDLLEKGTMLPPLTADGPVRIVVPFRYRWDGADENTDGSAIFTDKQFRAPIPPGRPEIVSSKNFGAVPTPKRGIYAFVGRNGKSFVRYQADAGMLLGVCPASKDAKAHGDDWSIDYGGTGGLFPGSDEPYAWVLVSEPTRRSPEEVRLARDQLMKGDVKRPPSSTGPSQ